VGWADEQCTPLFICYVNNRGQAGTKPEKKKEKGLTCGGYCCWRSCWSRLAASLVVRGSRRCYSFFFLSPLFFILFSTFSFFFSLLPLFSSLSVFFSLCPPPSLSYLVFFLLLPCFYRQKQGRDMARVATVLPPLHHPSNMWKVSLWQVGLVASF